MPTFDNCTAKKSELTCFPGGVLLGDAVVEAGASFLVALGPMDPRAHVVTVAACLALSVLLGRVLAPASTVIFVLRVTSARVGVVSERSKEGNQLARALVYGICAHHGGRDGEWKGAITATTSPSPSHPGTRARYEKCQLCYIIDNK